MPGLAGGIETTSAQLVNLSRVVNVLSQSTGTHTCDFTSADAPGTFLLNTAMSLVFTGNWYITRDS